MQNKHTHTHTRLTALFQDYLEKGQYEKGKINLDFTKARDSECSGISWAICKSAPSSRRITMPAPHHHLVFYRSDALPAAQPTASKHRMQVTKAVTKFDIIAVELYYK